LARTSNSERLRRILVLGRSHIGDCLLTTPAIRAVRRRFPEAWLDVSIPRSNSDLLAGNPHMDEILYRPPRSEWLAKARFVHTLRQRRYDLVVSFQEKSLFYGWAAGMSGAPRRVGLEHPRTRRHFTEVVPVRPGVHEVEKYLAVAAALGCDVSERYLELSVSGPARAAADQLLRGEGLDPETPCIGINPGATTANKRWAPERFAAVADALRADLRLPVLLFGGPGDAELSAQVARRMAAPPVELAGRVSLGETAALLARCRLLVTNDTGPMHMAAALAVPVVAVFGPTSPVKFGPYSALSTVVRQEQPCEQCSRPCLHTVSVEQVLASAHAQEAALPTPAPATGERVGSGARA
jgi:lipopolysaccharide heptosyltransferase II